MGDYCKRCGKSLFNGDYRITILEYCDDCYKEKRKYCNGCGKIIEEALHRRGSSFCKACWEKDKKAENDRREVMEQRENYARQAYNARIRESSGMNDHDAKYKPFNSRYDYNDYWDDD